jgi:hypothetical protein
MSEPCSFCAEPNVLHCMNRSLHHKHAEEDDKSGNVINQILLREKTSSIIKLKVNKIGTLKPFSNQTRDNTYANI